MLNALNFAAKERIQILNLPFSFISKTKKKLLSKIKSMSKRKTVFVCASGNQGPYFGSISSPGNTIYAISVGSYDYGTN